MRWFKSRSEGFWWVLSAIVVSVVGFILLYVGWEWLRSESQESRGTKIRNAFLIIGGLVAVLLAIWRSRVSERQTQVSNEQTKAALKQAGISHQSLLSERFQKGAEMLGSNTISVRLGGIYALKRIARDDPDIYHVQVMELFCAFVLNPTKSEAVGDQPRAEEGHLQLTSEVQAVMTGIGNRTEEGLALEQSARLRMELPGASLRGVGLFGANLSYVWFQNADLSYAYLCVANRSFANFLGANLEYANLVGANLSHANLIGANPSGKRSHSGSTRYGLCRSRPGTCKGKDMMDLEIRPYTESDDAVAADLWRPCSDVTVMRETS